MRDLPQIFLNHLSYSIPGTSVGFQDVSFAFKQRRYGIVGDNGTGKTTLLKLIAQCMLPQHGTVKSTGRIAYCPQQYKPAHPKEQISELLGIADKLQALHRIQQGQISEKDLLLLADNWDIHAKVAQAFATIGLDELDLARPVLSLSGGETTKCLLARVMLTNADFILLDEPTNNLDRLSRKKLSVWIKQAKQGFLIVGHDRHLLDTMDEIIEITPISVNHYGGNYSFYQQQKQIHQGALEQQLQEAKHQIHTTQCSIQRSLEKLEQRRKQGKTLKHQGKIDKLMANSMRGRSERTQSRHATQADKMLQQAKANMAMVRSQIEVKEPIRVNLEATQVPNGKIVLRINALNYAFPGQPDLFCDFHLLITGPERVAIAGNNGTGKTTLIQLILGHLKDYQGEIHLGVSPVCYLDQQVHFLKSNLSLVENLQICNPDMQIQEAYAALASFNFRNKDAEKTVCHLSGGERLRAGLAIRLLSKIPPQLMILDEPTNHLDIRSIEAIEQMLRRYEGALVVVSHDQAFLNNLGIHRTIILEKYDG
ncbi:ribosomal protection-like ABC-F family protein [Legionella oakridgensis]|uniref:ATPase component of ABC transporter with duplicated ATPase domains n=2 Tax=Legionella oakridgensis TaxID=29423 RepID=W0BEH0_9GAMM|nr:ABC-F family ATP-binding cassette domain-containing protein [Legionella oakridgensis]AHE67032.1 ATPase component of ABC transporter with duplicated ATPase domains [Legionella oakridgensis ATCC 33761 = DSM 21215]ETO93318.1 ATPase component of ABC transporter [Legionella oakridgensis RV-2-2007]KTD37183.1 ATPase component of ABC transporter [Legionella oakridgensis]STY20128.1 transporter fused subunits of ABC superfamily: ATP-binding components [Legionella longbeachae]